MAQDFYDLLWDEPQGTSADQNSGIVGDVVDMAQAGFYQSAGGIADFVGADGIAQAAYNRADQQYETLTPEMQEAMRKQIFVDNEDALLGVSLGDADWRTVVGNLSNVAGQMAVPLPGGAAVGLGAKVALKGIQAAKAAKIASGASTAALGLLNATSAGGQAGNDIRQQVLTSDYEQLAQFPEFKEMVRAVYEQNPEASAADILSGARSELAEVAARARMNDPASFAANAALGAIGDKYILDAIAKGVGKTALGATLKGAAVEGLTEAPQEALDTYGSNRVAKQYVDPSIDLMDNVRSSAATGGLLGGIMGGGVAGISHPFHKRSTSEPELNPDQTPEERGAQPGQVDLTEEPEVELTDEPITANPDLAEPAEHPAPVEPEFVSPEPAPADPEAVDVSATATLDEPVLDPEPVTAEPEEAAAPEVEGVPVDVSMTESLAGEPVPTGSSTNVEREPDFSHTIDNPDFDAVEKLQRAYAGQNGTAPNQVRDHIQRVRISMLEGKSLDDALADNHDKDTFASEQVHAALKKEVRSTNVEPEPEAIATDSDEIAKDSGELQKSDGITIDQDNFDAAGKVDKLIDKLETAKDKEERDLAVEVLALAFGTAKSVRKGEGVKGRDLRLRARHAAYKKLQGVTKEELMALSKADLKKKMAELELGRYRNKASAADAILNFRDQAPKRIHELWKEGEATIKVARLKKSNAPVKLSELKEAGLSGSKKVYTNGDVILANHLKLDEVAPRGQRGEHEYLFDRADAILNDPIRAIKGVFGKDKTTALMWLKSALTTQTGMIVGDTKSITAPIEKLYGVPSPILRELLTKVANTPELKASVMEVLDITPHHLEAEHKRTYAEKKAAERFAWGSIKDDDGKPVGLKITDKRTGDVTEHFPEDGESKNEFNNRLLGGISRINDMLALANSPLIENHKDVAKKLLRQADKGLPALEQRTTNVEQQPEPQQVLEAAKEVADNWQPEPDTLPSSPEPATAEEVTDSESEAVRKPVKPMARSFAAEDFDQEVVIDKVADGSFEIKAKDARVTGTHLPVKVKFDGKKKKISVDDGHFSYEGGGFKEAKQAALERAQKRVKMKVDVALMHQEDTKRSNAEAEKNAKQSSLERWQRQLKEEEAALEAAKRTASRMDRGWEPKPEDVSDMLAPFDGKLKELNKDNPWKLAEKILPRRISQVKEEIAKLQPDRSTKVEHPGSLSQDSILKTQQGEYKVEAVKLGEYVASADVDVVVGADVVNVKTGAKAFLEDKQLESLGYELEGAADLDRETMADELFQDGEGWMKRNAIVFPDDMGDPKRTVKVAKQVENKPFLTQAEADKRIEAWKQIAFDDFEKNRQANSQKTIISLFDSSGEWAKPYREAGFNVIQFDMNLVDGTGYEMDITKASYESFIEERGIEEVHGVLAACPCTDFAVSGARWWKGKDLNGDTEASIALVNKTLEIVEFFKPHFWAIENPVGRINKLTEVGEAQLTFQPHQLGSDYTKRTMLYGSFNTDLPTANVYPKQGSVMQNSKRGDVAQDKYDRSTTPEGMAYAFYMANGADRSLASEGWAEATVAPEKDRYFYKGEKYYRWNKAGHWEVQAGDAKLKPWKPVKHSETEKLNKAFGVEFKAAKRSTKVQQKPAAKTLQEALVDGGDIMAVVDYIGNNSKNLAYKRIAKRIREFIPADIDLLLVSDGAKLRKPIPRQMNTSKGMYWTKGDNKTLVLKDDSFEQNGMNEETVLHELLHAATVARIYEGNLVKNRGTELHTAVQELYDLQKAVTDHINANNIELDNQQLDAVNSVKELVAWGLTNPESQKILTGIKYKAKNAWSEFVKAIAKLLGIKKLDHTALGELIRVTDSILDAKPVEAEAETISSQVASQPSMTMEEAAASFRASTFAEPKKKKVSDILNNLGDKIRAGAIDRFNAFAKLDKARGLDPYKTPELSTWAQAKLVGAAQGALSVFMKYGRIKWDKDGVTLDAYRRKDGEPEGFAGVITQLGSEKEVKDFFRWIAANRANNLIKQEEARKAKWAEAEAERESVWLGKYGDLEDFKPRTYNPKYVERLFNEQEIAAGMLFNQGAMKDGRKRTEVYDHVFKQFSQYHADVLAIAEEGGIISEEARDAWTNDFYVPFFRVLDDSTENFGSVLSDGLAKQNVIKQIKGSEKALGDLLENYIMNTHALIEAAMKNKAAKHVVDVGVETGLVQRVGTHRDKARSTYIMEDGKKVHYQFNFDTEFVSKTATGRKGKKLSVSGRALFEAINALNPIGMNSSALNVARKFKRLFTNFTTASPAFMVRNLLRDSIQSSGMEQGGGRVVSGVKGYGVGPKISHLQARMLAGGGAFSFGHVYGDHSSEIMASVGGEIRRIPVMTQNNATAWFKKGIENYMSISDSLENANRAAVFQSNLQDGFTAANFRARDLMDFSAHGAWPAMRVLISTVPFLNARVQGLDKLWRTGTHKQRRARMFTMLGAMGVASAILHARNMEDDDYLRLPDWQRDSYWFIKLTKDDAVFLPKPFELGATATMIERLMDQMLGDPEDGAMRKAVARVLMDTFNFDPRPQIIKPAFEIYANYDSFRGRDIENFSDQSLPPSMVYGEHTSAPAKWVSSGMEAAIGEYALSGKQVDHLIRGYLGWVGTMVAGSADTIASLGDNTKTDRDWWEGSLVRWAYRDLNTPTYTKQQNLFYEALKEHRLHYSAYRELVKRGQFETAQDYLAENRDFIQRHKRLDKVQRYLSSLGRQEKLIRNNTSLTPQERRRMLDAIKAKKADIAAYMTQTLR